MALDDAAVYLETTAGILSVPKAGGEPRPVAPGSTGQVTGMLQAGGSLYWSQFYPGGIDRVETTGGVGAPVVTSFGYISSLGADDAYLYFTSLHPRGRLLRGGWDGQDISELVDISAYVNPAIALGSSDVYVIDVRAIPPQPVMVVAKSGGPPDEIAKVANTAGGIAADDTSVYWTEWAPDASPASGGVIRRAARGSPARTIANTTGDPTRISVDDRYVYWLANVIDPESLEYSGEIMRVAKDGGEPCAIASYSGFGDLIALDDSAVYWVAAGERFATGVVMRVAK
jgi:hypothetical protein